jgi:hypothetical protein
MSDSDEPQEYEVGTVMDSYPEEQGSPYLLQTSLQKLGLLRNGEDQSSGYVRITVKLPPRLELTTRLNCRNFASE